MCLEYEERELTASSTCRDAVVVSSKRSTLNSWCSLMRCLAGG